MRKRNVSIPIIVYSIYSQTENYLDSFQNYATFLTKGNKAALSRIEGILSKLREDEKSSVTGDKVELAKENVVLENIAYVKKVELYREVTELKMKALNILQSPNIHVNLKMQEIVKTCNDTTNMFTTLVLNKNIDDAFFSDDVPDDDRDLMRKKHIPNISLQINRCAFNICGIIQEATIGKAFPLSKSNGEIIGFILVWGKGKIIDGALELEKVELVMPDINKAIQDLRQDRLSAFLAWPERMFTRFGLFARLIIFLVAVVLELCAGYIFLVTILHLYPIILTTLSDASSVSTSKILKIMEGFLLTSIFFISGVGLYGMVTSGSPTYLPPWLRGYSSIDVLKEKFTGVIITIFAVSFLEYLLRFMNPYENGKIPSASPLIPITIGDLVGSGFAISIVVCVLIFYIKTIGNKTVRNLNINKEE